MRRPALRFCGQVAGLRLAVSQTVHVSFIKAFGESPGRMLGSLVNERKEKGCWILARHGLEKIELHLGQVVEAIVEDAIELLQVDR